MGIIAAERVALAAVLVTVPGLKVIPNAQPIEVVQALTAWIATAKVEPAQVASLGRVVTLEVWLISPATETGISDDALEDKLEQLLTGLDAAGVAWSSAEPAIWRDTHPAYRIETETTT